MRVDSDGVEIEFDVVGEGPPVVLLHGFPDTGRVWRHQVAALADRGHRVVVPDQRGYGRSGKPDDVQAYRMLHLVRDVEAILDHLDAGPADVVGHDWGASVAWALAAYRPERVGRLVTMAVGHPTSFREAGFEQRARSWYMLLFQFEGVAEQWLSGDGWANLRHWSGHPDADAVIADLERDGSLSSALAWYRANVPPTSWVAPTVVLPQVLAPTLGVWADQDFALTERQMAGSSRYVEGPWRYERLEGLGHWMQLEDPERVNQLLADFLG
jgi:pimeloyl-ACP methyl ester carboxylesterase